MLLPFEPVMATIGACASRQNSSISPTISTPALAAGGSAQRRVRQAGGSAQRRVRQSNTRAGDD
ncbi:hypothetical protein LTSEBAI_0248 [Salmonella enterica subsp. enterica serovar Baildon str. R6-199]|nr:hypothetical protein LTSEBAI_0248 [Salmonella enterica subsp. enterica serovar Baildon str. R6-199]